MKSNLDISAGKGTPRSAPDPHYTWLELFKIFNEGLISRLFWEFTLGFSLENIPAIASDGVQHSLRRQWNKASGKTLQKIYFIMLLLKIHPCRTSSTEIAEDKFNDFKPDIRLFYRLAGGSFFKSLNLIYKHDPWHRKKYQWLQDQQDNKFRLFFSRPLKTASSITAEAITTHRDLYRQA